MRVLVLLAICALALAQTPDPAYEPLTRAYDALRSRDYNTAITAFEDAVTASPHRSSIRKDLAYTYLKVGEDELARAQFHEAMNLDPADVPVALEYAFLCYESAQQPQVRRAEARRIFDRIRRTGNATAEQAFQNIDQPLAAGIERWKTALSRGSENFSTHFELATLAEQRDELALAAEQYEKAWKPLPDRRSVLVDLGRVWLSLGRPDEAGAALLAASRGGEPRAAEMARELLPDRYPYVSEFRRALELDPANAELRRELGYLLLRMDDEPEAEQQFRILADTVPDDLLSATQLGFLLFARGDHNAAQRLFDRVLAGDDEDLANRVRAVLRLPQVIRQRPEQRQQTIDAKVMAQRSIKAGYTNDALRYLQVAHETDPGDFDVMRRLAWTYNILHQDRMARRWFDLARKSSDPEIAADSERAYRNLYGAVERLRLTAWFFPTYSSRWQDFFGYAQVKTELRTSFPLIPYATVRFVGDTRLDNGGYALSESSFIVGAGVRTRTWHGLTGWFEAGSAITYSNGHMLPDYRGGFNAVRVLRRGPWFADTTADAVFISRFGNDFLVYDQSRFGIRHGSAQLYGNANLTVDVHRQPWADFIETGPGIRLQPAPMPESMYLTLNLLHGAYLTTGKTFNDFRAGLWYAFSY